MFVAKRLTLNVLGCGREHEITRLIRVDVSSSANGVLAVALSEQERGFAPYRLDNCTGLRLHLRCPALLFETDIRHNVRLLASPASHCT